MRVFLWVGDWGIAYIIFTHESWYKNAFKDSGYKKCVGACVCVCVSELQLFLFAVLEMKANYMKI